MNDLKPAFVELEGLDLSELPEIAQIFLQHLGTQFGPLGDYQFILGDVGTKSLEDLIWGPPPPTKVMYEPNVKFSYYGKTGNTADHGGIIVIASVVNEENGVINYGVAFCSPKDRYDKAKGKELAYNDLCTDHNIAILQKKTHHSVNAGIFADMIAGGCYPSWAKTAVAIQAIKHIKEAMIPQLHGRKFHKK